MTPGDEHTHGVANATARRLFAGLPDQYDRLLEVLTFGQNARWRRAMLAPVVAADPTRVLDVASGTAGVARALAVRTRATVTGVDLSEQMLATAGQLVRRDGSDARVRLVLARAEQLPFGDASFDALTFTYLLRYVEDPAATLRELTRVVRPGGMVASLEFHRPARWLWRAPWWAYTRALLPAAGAVLGGRAWYEVGRFLGPSISQHWRTYPLEDVLDAWRRAGVAEPRHRVMSLGGGVVIWGRVAGG